MFEAYTDEARRVVVFAQQEARLLDHPYVGTEHLLAGLIRVGEASVATAVLRMSLEEIRREIEAITGRGQKELPGDVAIPFTLSAKKTLDLSSSEAAKFGDDFVGPDHIFLSLIREDNSVVAELLERRGIRRSNLRERVTQIFREHEPNRHSDGNP